MSDLEVDGLRLDHWATIVGPEWLRVNVGDWRSWLARRVSWFAQLEQDLAVLVAHVGMEKARSAYQHMLRDRRGIQKAIFEIHAAALFGTAGRLLDLHVPCAEGGGRDFDVLAEIAGQRVQTDSKTRKDSFPFNTRATGVAQGVSLHEAQRPIIDPHEYADQADADYSSTPESTAIRQKLTEALIQLPTSGCNIIAWGQIEGWRCDMEDALFGPVRQRTHYGDTLRCLSAVLWIELRSLLGSPLMRDYALLENTGAATPLSTAARDALLVTIRQWRTLDGGSSG
jgi:hypothetical protein